MNGPHPHAHRYTTDTFYVLEGTLHMTVGDSAIDAPAGSYILVPPGVAHTFANISDEPARFLNISAAGGLEQYLRDVADAMRSGTMAESSRRSSRSTISWSRHRSEPVRGANGFERPESGSSGRSAIAACGP
jgi:oxalate decarboxylase/phosphoglucose isomerase-like protein (cupin superfamily)